MERRHAVSGLVASPDNSGLMRSKCFLPHISHVHMEIWQTILLAFGGNAALLAVLGVLGKSVLDKFIVRDTKQFESDLKAKSDTAIEHLRKR